MDGQRSLLEAIRRDSGSVGHVRVNEDGPEQGIDAPLAKLVKAMQGTLGRAWPPQLEEQDDAGEALPCVATPTKARV